ncbi:MAG: TIGR00730 family Rossman fold protein [Clostridia bacterium]|nr:TIGR00730 family Rossman fold protein [Clostridia bacterium]
MNICVYGASSNAIDPKYLDAVEKLGAKMAQRGHGLVFGGGNSGVMGASARGMFSQNGKIIGIAPTFFQVDGVLYPHCTEFYPTETMRERKKLLEEKSDAFISAPGGIGTFDEFFEILTLKQLARHNKPIAMFNVAGYYDPMLKMLQHTAKEEFMNESSFELFRVFSDADKMLTYIEEYDEPAREVSFFKKIGNAVKK